MKSSAQSSCSCARSARRSSRNTTRSPLPPPPLAPAAAARRAALRLPRPPPGAARCSGAALIGAGAAPGCFWVERACLGRPGPRARERSRTLMRVLRGLVACSAPNLIPNSAVVCKRCYERPGAAEARGLLVARRTLVTARRAVRCCLARRARHQQPAPALVLSQAVLEPCSVTTGLGECAEGQTFGQSSAVG